jgi:hypothetical protein
MIMVTLTAGIMFLFTFRCGELKEGFQRVGRQPVRWSATAESLKNSNINRTHNAKNPLLTLPWQRKATQIFVNIP